MLDAKSLLFRRTFGIQKNFELRNTDASWWHPMGDSARTEPSRVDSLIFGLQTRVVLQASVNNELNGGTLSL